MDDERERRVEYAGTGFYVGLGATLVVALILLVLAVQNTQDVMVSFLGWDFTFPLFGVAIGAALAAVVLDELIGLVWRRRRRAQLADRAELRRLRDKAAEPPEAARAEFGEEDLAETEWKAEDLPFEEPE